MRDLGGYTGMLEHAGVNSRFTVGGVGDAPAMNVSAKFVWDSVSFLVWSVSVRGQHASAHAGCRQQYGHHADSWLADLSPDNILQRGPHKVLKPIHDSRALDCVG